MALRPNSDNSITFYSKQVVFNYVNASIEVLFTKIFQTVNVCKIFYNLAFQGLVRIYILVFGI